MEKYIVPCSKKISKLCHETVEHTIPNRIGTCFECRRETARLCTQKYAAMHKISPAFPRDSE